MYSTIPEAVSATKYPGRGIIAAKSNEKIYLGCFIMGRSENSRNRVFGETPDGIRTEAYDPSKLTDPSLVIYNPVRVYKSRIIVSNGDQTDTVYEFLKNGKTLYEALETRDFEPDCPNYTPRITAVLNGEKLTMSVIRSAEGMGLTTVRSFFNYDELGDDEGLFIHTYADCKPVLESFEGEPEGLLFSGGLYEFFSEIWDNLDFDNRISLWVGEFDPSTGVLRSCIANKNSAEFKVLNDRRASED